MQIGFIPLFEILLSVLSCGSEYDPPDKFWSSLGYSCFAGGHLAFVVVSLLCASAFLALVGIYAFIFIDSNPLSPGYDGCSSGHAALLTLLWKAVMIFLVQTIPDRLGSWGVTSVVVIAGLAHISITFLWVERRGRARLASGSGSVLIPAWCVCVSVQLHARDNAYDEPHTARLRICVL